MTVRVQWAWWAVAAVFHWIRLRSTSSKGGLVYLLQRVYSTLAGIGIVSACVATFNFQRRSLKWVKWRCYWWSLDTGLALNACLVVSRDEAEIICSAAGWMRVGRKGWSRDDDAVGTPNPHTVPDVLLLVITPAYTFWYGDIGHWMRQFPVGNMVINPGPFFQPRARVPVFYCLFSRSPAGNSRQGVTI
jgi:hypothetical protein